VAEAAKPSSWLKNVNHQCTQATFLLIYITPIFTASRQHSGKYKYVLAGGVANLREWMSL